MLLCMAALLINTGSIAPSCQGRDASASLRLSLKLFASWLIDRWYSSRDHAYVQDKTRGRKYPFFFLSKTKKCDFNICYMNSFVASTRKLKEAHPQNLLDQELENPRVVPTLGTAGYRDQIILSGVSLSLSFDFSFIVLPLLSSSSGFSLEIPGFFLMATRWLL